MFISPKAKPASEHTTLDLPPEEVRRKLPENKMKKYSALCPSCIKVAPWSRGFSKDEPSESSSCRSVKLKANRGRAAGEREIHREST
jgi:hypothetical protein